MKASEFFLRAANKIGIKHIFGVIGAENQFINFDHAALPDFVLTRHEFTAGIMGDAYGRLTGEPQIAFCTFAPGLTNMASAVASAMQDRSPVIFVSPQIPSSNVLYNVAHQCIDNVRFMKPITKWAVEIKEVKLIPSILKKAVHIAQQGISGPVYISFPVDLMAVDVDSKFVEKSLKLLSIPEKKEAKAPSLAILKKIKEKIKKAKHPLLVIGNQVMREKVATESLELAVKLNIPIICTLAGKGAIPEDHPLFLTAYNRYLDVCYGEFYSERVFKKNDLLILIGFDVGEDIKPTMWKPNTPVVMMNAFHLEMKKVLKTDLNCIGNIQKSLEYLINSDLKPKKIASDLLDLKKIFDKRNIDARNEEKTHLGTIIKNISFALGKEGILCSDVGFFKQFVGLFYKSYLPNTFLCSNVFGSFGFGLPAAMGAQIAKPNARICLIGGDGGFHSSSHDLETVARMNLPIVMIVLKSNSMGLIQLYQRYGNIDGPKTTKFGDIDFVKLAEANGVRGCRLSNMKNLEQIMHKAYTSRKPYLIEIAIDYDLRFADKEVLKQLKK